MSAPYTDLALESAELFQAKNKNVSALPGCRTLESTHFGYPVTHIRIRGRAAAQALDKPEGTYITMDLRPYFQRRSDFFPRGVRCLAAQLTALLPRQGEGSTLVVGLGNPTMTSDAVGPMAVQHVLVTRHMLRALPSFFSSVAALTPGVAGQSGMESLELIRAAVDMLHPRAVIAVDALAGCSAQRLCAAVQLSDTGLVPGSGVGNRRSAIDQNTLGVPVIALGLPTVIRASTLISDLTGQSQDRGRDLFVTHKEVDSRIRELSRLMGYGITMALQPQLTVSDITGLLG